MIRDEVRQRDFVPIFFRIFLEMNRKNVTTLKWTSVQIREFWQATFRENLITEQIWQKICHRSEMNKYKEDKFGKQFSQKIWPQNRVAVNILQKFLWDEHKVCPRIAMDKSKQESFGKQFSQKIWPQNRFAANTLQRLLRDEHKICHRIEMNRNSTILARNFHRKSDHRT